MSKASRKAILEQAAATPELVAEVSPVIAAGFGVLPLRRLGDRLTVACFADANRRALRALRDLLGLEIVATPFDSRLLHGALQKAYFEARESVNLPTFLDPDFLDDPACLEALGAEKVEQIPTGVDALPADAVAVCELSYRSRLTNRDHPTRGGALPDRDRLRLVLGETELAWLWRDGRPAPRGPVGDDVRLLLNEYRFTSYDRGPTMAQVSEHEIRAGRLIAVPHVVHPTEVQVVALDPDGGLQVHVYDHVEAAPVGRATVLSVAYHFLSYGSRLERRIEVELHPLPASTRAALTPAASDRWGRIEVARWLDLAPSGSMHAVVDPRGRPDRA